MRQCKSYVVNNFFIYRIVMATGGYNPDEEQHANYYDLLGVSLTSTGEEIRSAFLQKARQYHPDKNYDRNTEELMKLFNKAYQVLRDPVERERYDEHLECDEASGSQKPLAALGHGHIASLEIRQLYESSLRTNPKYLSVVKNFSTTLNASITKFSWQKFKDFFPNHDLEARTQSTSIHKQSILTEILKEIDEVQDTTVSQNDVSESVLFDIVKFAQTVKNPNMADVISVGTEVPIIDFSHIGIKQLYYLLHLFSVTLLSEKLFEAEAIAALDDYIPKVHVSPIDATVKTKLSFRKVCCVCKVNKCHCQLRMPRFGLMTPQSVCQQCKSQALNQDMNDWISLGHQLLQQSGSILVPKVVGCFAMAVCTNPESYEPFLKLKEFVACGMPHIAIVFVPTIIESIQQKEVFKGYLLAASALKCISDFEVIGWYDKWNFLIAAKEAYSLACYVQVELDENIDIPSLPLLKAELESKIFAILDEKEVEYNNLISKTLAELELAWGERKISKIIKLITAERDNDLLYVLNKEGIM